MVVGRRGEARVLSVVVVEVGMGMVRVGGRVVLERVGVEVRRRGREMMVGVGVRRGAAFVRVGGEG